MRWWSGGRWVDSRMRGAREHFKVTKRGRVWLWLERQGSRNQRAETAAVSDVCIDRWVLQTELWLRLIKLIIYYNNVIFYHICTPPLLISIIHCYTWGMWDVWQGWWHVTELYNHQQAFFIPMQLFDMKQDTIVTKLFQIHSVNMITIIWTFVLPTLDAPLTENLQCLLDICFIVATTITTTENVHT